MAVIIGAGTIVNFNGADCVISASWSASSNTERLYCLGTTTPHLTIARATQSLNIVIYAPGDPYSLDVTNICANANTITASVSPAGCGGSVTGVSGQWFVNQYAYAKEDPALPGQETWSMVQWVYSGNGIIPNYVLRSISEGEGTDNSGIVFAPGSTTAYNGSVAANSIGRADVVSQGIVESVGGGEGAGPGTGTGSVQIPYIPLYL